MATFAEEVYIGAGPSWTDIGTNRLIFSGSGGLDQLLTVGQYQDEMHLGDGTPGADQCGANHVPNVKYVDDNNMDIGAGSAAINDTNLAETDCTFRVTFSDPSSVAISNARLYAYDNSVTTNPATGVDVKAFERGEGNSAWTTINDASGGIGGDNAGERLSLADKAAATSHTWYLAVSAAAESVGGKSDFALGVALTYS